MNINLNLIMIIFRNEAVTQAASWSFKFENNPNLEFIVTQPFFSDCKNPRLMNKSARDCRLNYTEFAKRNNNGSPPRRKRKNQTNDDDEEKDDQKEEPLTSIQWKNVDKMLRVDFSQGFKKHIENITDKGLIYADKWNDRLEQQLNEAKENEQNDGDIEMEDPDQWIKDQRHVTPNEKKWKWGRNGKYFDHKYLFDDKKKNQSENYDTVYKSLRKDLNVKSFPFVVKPKFMYIYIYTHRATYGNPINVAVLTATCVKQQFSRKSGWMMTTEQYIPLIKRTHHRVRKRYAVFALIGHIFIIQNSMQNKSRM